MSSTSTMNSLPLAESREGCTELLKRILSLLAGRPEVALTPPVYAVLFEHLAGNHPMLSKEVGKLVGSGEPVTTASLTLLFDRFLAISGVDSRRTSDRFQAAAQRAADAAEATLNSTDAYSGDLTRLSEAFRDGAAPQELESRVRAVALQTENMRSVAEALRFEASASVQEIQELQAELTKARLEAITDPLSQLLNRRGLQQMIREVFSAPAIDGQGPCLVALDIDNFKRVNDTFGHQLGDRVIAAVGKAIQGAVGPDCFAARVGGEEFTLLMKSGTAQQAKEVAERIRARVSAAIALRDKNTGEIVSKVTLSAGVAVLSQGGDFEDMERRADEALYRAKQGGRDRVEIADHNVFDLSV